jgi:hypothetical protein
MGILKILAGAAILLLVIIIYVAVSYMHDKKMGKNNSCNGNCAGCGMRSESCGADEKKAD